MATTSPDNLRTPNPTDPYNLVADLAILASDTQEALVKRGNFYIGTSSQRIAFTSAPDGTHWQDTDGSKYEWVRSGGSWRGLTPLRGSALLTPPTGGGVVTHPITFPPGYFETPPSVMVNPRTAVRPSTEVRANSINITTSGVDIVLARSSGAATTVDWVAIPG